MQFLQQRRYIAVLIEFLLEDGNLLGIGVIDYEVLQLLDQPFELVAGQWHRRLTAL